MVMGRRLTSPSEWSAHAGHFFCPISKPKTTICTIENKQKRQWIGLFILNWILGGTSLAGIVGFFVYRKENKKLKENEVAAASVETQSKEIDLGKKYIEESVNVVKGIKSLLEANNAEHGCHRCQDGRRGDADG